MRLEDEIAQKQFRNQAHKLVVNIIYTYNWLMNYQQTMLKPHGITGQQFNVLRILRGQHPNPASIKLVRERMLDKMSDASRIVEKLRMKGLVERHTCPTDRRVCDVTITAKGLALLQILDKENEKVNEMTDRLTEDERQTVNDLLDKMRG